MHLRPKGIGDRGGLGEVCQILLGPSNALTAERHWRLDEGGLVNPSLLCRPSNALTAERHWRRGSGP